MLGRFGDGQTSSFNLVSIWPIWKQLNLVNIWPVQKMLAWIGSSQLGDGDAVTNIDGKVDIIDVGANSDEATQVKGDAEDGGIKGMRLLVRMVPVVHGHGWSWLGCRWNHS